MSDRKIGDLIKQLAGTFGADEVYLLPCTVDSVDLSTRSCNCTPVGGNATTELPDVKLMADVDDGVLIEPAIGSLVLVMLSKRTAAMVIMYSEIAGITMIAGDMGLKLTANGIVMNGGGYGGLIKINELKTQLEKNNSLLSALIDTLSGAPIAEPGNGAPSALQQALAVAIQGKALANFKDIENTNITHGNKL